MIVFVGDKPAKANLNPDIPFVGTKSYKRLLEWIYKLDLDLTDLTVCNSADFKEYHWGGQYFIENRKSFYLDLDPTLDLIIPLGDNAEKIIKKTSLPYFKLPHPSFRNRLFNKSNYEQEVLNDCREWLRGKGYYERFEH